MSSSSCAAHAQSIPPLRIVTCTSTVHQWVITTIITSPPKTLCFFSLSLFLLPPQELFEEFQHGKQSVIPPDTLRKAMAECYEGQHRFQLGLMDDAAECFVRGRNESLSLSLSFLSLPPSMTHTQEKILEQLHLQLTGSEDMDTCPAQHCISHQKFSLTILERVSKHNKGKQNTIKEPTNTQIAS